MDWCKDKNITKVKSECICISCASILGYEYTHFNYDDYNLNLNNMLKYKNHVIKEENI